MERLTVECLRCGMERTLARRERARLHDGECPRCGYVGWAGSGELDETLRRALRVVPLASRRLRQRT